jgi:ABC-type phosphate transport system substrate-binding protein
VRRHLQIVCEGKKMKNRKRWLAAGISASLAAAGIVGLMASPASADPATTYVATGSDTIQDVMNGMAGIVGAGILGSWDAFNPGSTLQPPGTLIVHDMINPKANCHFSRPNGSGEGLSALRKSINPAGVGDPAKPLPVMPQAGCVDVARSSSGPSSTVKTTTGVLVYIPFALDAVAPATGGTTNITQADNFTKAQLQGLYQCTPQLVGGVTYDPNSPPATGNTPIHLYIPQPGSGTRSFWEGQMGITEDSSGNPPICVHDHSVVDNTAVEEHDGTVLSGDPAGIGPFSIAQWIAQSNGHNDRRHGAVLRNLNGVTPISSGVLNTAYPITREVFNVMLINRVTPGDPSFDQGLYDIFVTAPGHNSIVCSQTLSILDFGFAPLSASTPHTCGQVASDLRAFASISVL